MPAFEDGLNRVAGHPRHPLKTGDADRGPGPAPQPVRAIRGPVADRRYRPDIDGLRAVAVGAVIAFHFGLGPFGGGFVGVDVFFVISGFLITTVLRDVGDGFPLARFAERRIRRIVPALLVVLAVAALWSTRQLPNDLKTIGLGLINATIFSSNIYFGRLAGDYFSAGILAEDPALHTWSLGVEAQFYAVIALLWMAGRRRPRAHVTLLGLLGAGSLAASFWAVRHAPNAAFYLTPFRLWEFLLGAAATLPPLPAEAGPGRWALGVALGLGMIGFAAIDFGPDTAFPGTAALLPCAGAALVLRGGATSRNPASRWLGASPLAWAGRLSYALYLWHWPLLVFATAARVTPLPLAARLGLLGPTLLLAWATHRLVERPVIARRLLASPQSLLATCGIGAACVIGVGLLVNLAGQNRLVLRSFPPAVMRLAAGQFDTVDVRCPATGARDIGCRFGTPGGEPRLVLWGNSFARMWLPALDRAASRAGMSGLAVTVSRCPPLLDVAFPSLPGCSVANRDALAFIAARPALKTVILGGDWSAWPADLPALARTVATLATLGRHVVLLLSPPAVPYRVPPTLARAALDDSPPPPLVALAEALRERAAERETIAAIAVSTDVTVVDPTPAFCDAWGCAVAADGRSLYYDNAHVTRFGAERASALFDAVMRRRAAQPAVATP